MQNFNLKPPSFDAPLVSSPSFGPSKLRVVESGIGSAGGGGGGGGGGVATAADLARARRGSADIGECGPINKYMKGDVANVGEDLKVVEG